MPALSRYRPIAMTPPPFPRSCPGWNRFPTATRRTSKTGIPPAGVVFFRSPSPGSLDRGASVLADVPDFNSLESRNWERAEKLLRQAEVVVFLLTPDTYADQVTIRELERACRIAARMIVVFTKVLVQRHLRGTKNPGQMERFDRVEIADLNHSFGVSFASRRGDGKTLLEFFETLPGALEPSWVSNHPRFVVPLEKGHHRWPPG